MTILKHRIIVLDFEIKHFFQLNITVQTYSIKVREITKLKKIKTTLLSLNTNIIEEIICSRENSSFPTQRLSTFLNLIPTLVHNSSQCI
jgi:hypothetical protein